MVYIFSDEVNYSMEFETCNLTAIKIIKDITQV